MMKSDENKENSKEVAKTSNSNRIFTMILALIVLAGLLLGMVSFQVEETEYVVVSRWGKPATSISEPGLHWKLPYPIDKIWSVDKRIHLFNGENGRLEEVKTADGDSLTVSIYILWRVSNPLLLREESGSIEEFEAKLNRMARSARASVFSQIKKSDIFNTEKGTILPAIEDELRKVIATQANASGVEVITVGIDQLNLPDTIATKVLDSMEQEKNRERDRIISEGEKEKERIVSAAETKGGQIVAEAEAAAKLMKAEAEAEAVEYFETLAKSPKLAALLKKIEALKESVDENTTLILDDETPPFDLLSNEKAAEPRKKPRR